MNNQPDYFPNSIAVVGMAGRFPKARNLDQFWQNLVSGVESIHTLTDEQLEGVELEFEKAKTDPDYVRARGMLDDIDLFDAKFFGLTPREARALDPQQRIWLETAWTALENAGYTPEKYDGAIGVYAGAYYNGYLFYNLLEDRAAIEQLVRFRSLDAFLNIISNDKDYLPTRTSFLFNLKGPSVNVQTACSTSLVAVAQACQSLLNFECDMTLAGGICVAVPQEKGYFYQEGGMTSADGHCRPFDDKATGTVFSSGVGIVVLKRLEDALADGDTISAIIRGAALNNDGAQKASYTAPSVDGQAEVISLAQAIADVDPETISYVEAHGTATPLGDPIEVAGLTKAFRQQTDKTQFCGLGSVKSNVGHLDAASGVTGLLKTVMALQNEELPPTLHYEKPNREIDFENSPFYVVNKRTPWPKGKEPRRAGVSSFGVGGTNAHVVVEEAPELPATTGARPRQLILVSGKTETAVSTQAANLTNALTDQNLADAAYTLAVGRADHPYRRAYVVDSVAKAAELLRSPKQTTEKTIDKNAPVVFMFPGQGSQHVNMGRELYETEPTFRATVDECAAILQPLLDLDLRDLLYPESLSADEAAKQLQQTAVAQPAIFTIEYALAQLWLEWGIQPSAMVGHSVGEFAAACLAGVFSLEDALTILATRAKLMQAVAPGSMRAVRLSLDELQPHLGNGVTLAANNAPNICIVSGPTDAIEAFDHRLDAAGIATIELHTSHAFHSEMMDEVLEAFETAVSATTRHAPQLPILSTLTGTWLTNKQAVDPVYWTQQLRQPVRFSQAIRALQEEPGRVYLEVGPGNTLSTSTRQHPDPTMTVIASLGHAKAPKPALETMLEALGKLWLAGANIDWTGFYQHETRRRIPLPTYPFERQRYWVEPPPLESAPSTQKSSTGFQPVEQTLQLINNHSQDGYVTEATVLETVNQEDVMTQHRRQKVSEKLGEILYDLSGIEFATADYATPFVEMGFDSLTLTQVSSALKGELSVSIKFRKLLENVNTVDALADYCLEKLPANMFAEAPPQPVAQAAVATPVAQAVTQTAVSQQQPVAQPIAQPVMPTNGNGYGTNGYANGHNGHHASPNGGTAPAAPNNATQQLIQQQLQLMQQQLQLLGGQPQAYAQPAAPMQAPAAAPQIVEKVVVKEVKAKRPKAPAKAKPTEIKKGLGFGPYAPVKRGEDGNLTPAQQAHLQKLIDTLVSRTKTSKEQAQLYREVLAYPRAIYGYRRLWKEMVYQIVAERSKGAHLWDVDGNKYVDITMGFGVNFLGHSPDIVTEALHKELDKGVEIGPHARLSGETAKMIRELTSVERVSFCNTGSEAVMGALRLARTVTGKSKVVYFNGDYHGIFDEALARPQVMKGELHSMTVAPGLMPEAVQNVYILDYGTDGALEFIRENINDIAAVLVEPVQSRHPYNRPIEFLRQVRDITANNNSALVFDEVITGFRVNQGGIQAEFGIQADLVTYGKVIGGGIPIGVIAGKAQFMDALDGGQWRYGDSSEPEADLTFFAGTFIRHPLSIAAAHAVVSHLKAEGPQLQQRVNDKTTAFVNEMNLFFELVQVPIRLRHYSSWFRFDYPSDIAYVELLFFHLLSKGIYVLSSGQNCFFSTEHSDEDIAFLANAIKEGVRELQTAGFLPASDDAPFPLTEAQQEIWLASQMGDAASTAYNESFSLRLRGTVRPDAFRQAVQAVLNRHDGLHMRFGPEGDWQQRAADITVEIPYFDWSDLSANAQDARLTATMTQESKTPFDLASGPLLRTQLIKLSEQEHIFLFAAHHIVFDGWSSSVVVDEVRAVYNGLAQNQGYSLPDPDSFRDFVRYEQASQVDEEGQESLAFWLSQFETTPPVLQLPTDTPRPSTKTFGGAAQFYRFDPQIIQAVKQTAASEGVTMYVFLLAAYQVLLHQLSGQDDLVVGIPVAGQLTSGMQSLVGHCVNMLPLRMGVNGRSAFRSHLQNTKNGFLDSQDYQATTFGTILRNLRLPRDASRSPLVEVVFNLDRRIPDEESFVGLETIVRETPKQAINWDMFLNLIEVEDTLTANLDYNTDILTEATVIRWLAQYENLLAALASNPTQYIETLPLLSAEDETTIAAWNDTAQPHDNERQLQQMVEAQAAKRPKAVAAVFEGETISYGELDKRGNQLAHLLRGRGVVAGTKVGILMDRSLEMVVAVLGVLKAGGTYIPAATDYPPERVAFILNDSESQLLIAQPHVAPTLQGVVDKPIIELDSSWQTVRGQSDAALALDHDPDGIACIIYTSGSTGKPKGVMLAHRGLCNYMQWKERHFGLTSDDAMIMKAPFGFDAATWEIFSPMAVGGRTVIAKQGGQIDMPYLIDLMARERVTFGFIVPTQIRALLDDPNFASCQSLRTVVVGGEAFPEDLRDKFHATLPNCNLHNVYGPTETTIVVMSWNLADGKPSDTLTPIGYPNDNTQTYVLSEAMQPVPVGVVGELYIGGVQVGRGYWQRPELTAERFVDNPFSLDPNAKLYKTGDRVRYRADGAIEYIGRADYQVKLRGQRVELGEIESGLQGLTAVKQALVVVREESVNDKRLIGYFTLNPGAAEPTNAKLRDHLRQSMPEFMVPNAFVTLDAFPITPNGKLDRAALPAPSYARDEETEGFVTPRNALEFKLADAWKQVLKVDQVGIHDNFFDLGGHSLMALRLFSKIEAETGKKLPLSTLFEAPTIAQLAERLEDDGWKPSWSSLVPIQPQGHKRPFFHIAPYLISVLNFTDLGKYLDPERPFYGIQPQGLDADQPIHATIEEMATHYIKEIKMVQPEGPYLLGGHCAGAWVAYEMAKQLEAQGEEIEYLGIIDSPAPNYVEPSRGSLPYFGSRAMFYLKERRLLNALAWKLKLQSESKLLYKYGTPQSQRIKAVREAHDKAYDDYEVTAGYSGPMSIVRSREHMTIYENADWYLLWEELTTGSVDYADVDCTHATLLKQPYVQDLGQKMWQQIEGE
ncbi:MAG: amino acid adenylation domain-containing protein [Chloroflexota bacterium]